MRIIQENLPEAEKKVTCKGCGSLLGYYEKDVKSYVHHDYGGGSDTVYYVECPKCSKQITVNA